ncbi:hypothetical protein [Polluticaenibacter yanchengensis]|uniref:Uncharacterized protein n=1 Tax=Polluticaenibacter yanchengensis TaxID=3014562 RepID=A0ABT4UJ74_9BACT|nr:hypothetical protein [Chitinophagaceae bacterium LY-5]
MRIPYFVVTILLAILSVILMFKSFDYGHGWAIALAILSVLLFGILSVIAVSYEIKQGEAKDAAHHDGHH